ncbi:bifunctional adenosylcobinamide kinase/adenosylcobinamide-phosphate guanylyltransferase [Pandoraea sp.]|uniref:bifunctional adenosylcobinamide kinase/adenosylcobinamide-phosphate guanylyltransferase n=1 Tax=Pandoraea sp. TaxID=1883445 RepID=UPI001204DFFE|nr:bifunctional adenosylcobinamide kinase/adenosylcobinamide-phosphate guanylyltransferase [Pandoraea sp.]TAL54439.1 MAG: bifunctional adenosylcobinamide kinase/adenosylcobinamide-phosphate guanylyltransferase [Pandoraea sp.]TAM17488.1 MAG: bifunctional adenosylcobinamide kinase/adenosylcobinamide-phosphate guanylyltransferase [Pandoraea sp.]
MANPVPDSLLVLGGARSGKSTYAEQLAHDSGLPVTYLATAHIADTEMAERIAVHRARRPAHWQLREVGRDLPGALAEAARPGHCVLVDCLTLWTAAWLCPPDAPAASPAAWANAVKALDDVLHDTPGKIILVSNEIGMGVIPMGAMTRQFVDELGRLNQRLAARCSRVCLMVAGIAMPLKG